uniref:Fibronectin leucine rich transmembrane protein 1 n=1 Tax=Tetraodon nigroviridis TaxID=99883 RepID=H3C0V5_TETNG
AGTSVPYWATKGANSLFSWRSLSMAIYNRKSGMLCPSVCRCDEDFIYCNDRGLSSIPSLPPSASVLYLQNNQINNPGLPTSLEHHLAVRVVYLYDNELDEFPLHLPPSVRELHLQDNNIRTIPRSALARMPLLEKLHLDDNSISTVSIEDQAFADNPRLRLLFLSRNHLSSIPYGMRRLQRLDLSGNNLTTLPKGLFKDLDGLGQLLVRGNPWHCGCNLRWLYDWLHARGNTITVRGLTCHGPDRVRDMALLDLSSEMEECDVVRTAGNRDRVGGGGIDSSTTQTPPQGSLFTLRSKRPGLGFPDSGLDYTLSSSGVGKSLALNVKPLSHNSVRVTWSVAQPSSSFRLSWLRLGAGNAMGSITETLVRGDRREYLLTSLQPRSSYIICMVPLSANSEGKGTISGDTDSDEALVCAKAETSDPTPLEEEDGDDSKHMTVLPLAGIIGGATAIVSLALIFSVFCWYGHRTGHLCPRDHYTRSSSRKSKNYDDYIESGTKKDNSILEIRGPGFQMTPMAACQPMQAKPLREDYIIHTHIPSNGTGLYKGASQVANAGHSTNRGYREGGIPDIDYCYT